MQGVRTRPRRFHVTMEDEHDRLEDTLADVEWSLRAGDTDTARRQLATFEAGLNRYVHGEERLLFPALDALVLNRTRFDPTASMRREHRSLRKLTGAIWDSFARGDGSDAADALSTLRSVFLLHIAKEDLVIYPLLHRAVSSTTEEALVQAFQ